MFVLSSGVMSVGPAKTAETILGLLEGFNSKNAGPTLMTPELRTNMQILDKFRHESESILSKSQDCEELLNTCRTLATKEASLRISLQELQSVQPQPSATQVTVEQNC